MVFIISVLMRTREWLLQPSPLEIWSRPDRSRKSLPPSTLLSRSGLQSPEGVGARLTDLRSGVRCKVLWQQGEDGLELGGSGELSLPPLLSSVCYIPLIASLTISSSLWEAGLAVVVACVVSSKGLMPFPLRVYGVDTERMQVYSLWVSLQLCGVGGAPWWASFSPSGTWNKLEQENDRE